MFNSNEKTNCYCCIKLCQPDSDEAAYPCGSPQPPRPYSAQPAATPDNLSGFQGRSEWVCAMPRFHAATVGGTKRTLSTAPGGGGTAESHCTGGSACESHNDSGSKEDPATTAQGFWSPAASLHVFFFFEILIRSNDRHDELEAALPDNTGVKNERRACAAF